MNGVAIYESLLRMNLVVVRLQPFRFCELGRRYFKTDVASEAARNVAAAVIGGPFDGEEAKRMTLPNRCPTATIK